MAGYAGYSMSNNAVDAYMNGEKPWSKWTKKELIDRIKADGVEPLCGMEAIKGTPVEVLRKLLLRHTSSHHTSKFYNLTKFYSFDDDYLQILTKQELDDATERVTSVKEEKGEIWKVSFLEWSGTRKHPKATEVVEIGELKMGWFYRKNGKKKSIYTKNFKLLEKIK